MEFKHYPPERLSQISIDFQDQPLQIKPRAYGYRQGKYYFMRREGKTSNAYAVKDCVSREQVLLLRRIRKSLNLKVKYISKYILRIGLSTLQNKESGIAPMLKIEYDELMRFYRREKLKRTFGANYREGMFKCD